MYVWAERTWKEGKEGRGDPYLKEFSRVQINAEDGEGVEHCDENEHKARQIWCQVDDCAKHLSSKVPEMHVRV